MPLSMSTLCRHRQPPTLSPVVRARQPRRLRHTRLQNDRSGIRRLCDRLGHAPHESYLITVMLMSLVATVCGSQHYYSDSSYTLPPLSSQPRSTLRIARPRGSPPTPPQPHSTFITCPTPPHSSSTCTYNHNHTHITMYVALLQLSVVNSGPLKPFAISGISLARLMM